MYAISQIIAMCNVRKQVSCFEKLHNLLLFLSELYKAAQQQKLLEIHPRNEGKLCIELEEDQRICLLSNATEKLLKSGALALKKFNDQLIQMNYWMIEVKYPSPSFRSVYNNVVTIKNSIEYKSRVQLGVIIFRVNETDQQFHRDSNINFVRNWCIC